MIVRELLTRFSFSTDTAAQSRVEGSIQRISGLLSGIAAFASLRALSQVADSMQSLEARIGMLPQTIGDVGEAFNEVARNASANRQSIEAYGAFYTKVGNAAKGLIKDQGQLLQVTNTISQALVVGGASTMEAQSAMLQFGQALGSGVLQGDEFRSMAEAAPQYLDALSEAMNIPRENLKKMASEGKLTSKAVIEATLKMSSMFESKFRQMPMTIGQATTIMGNRFKTMIGNMNRESQLVTTIANGMIAGFDRIEAGFGKVIDAVGGASNALKLLGIAAAAILGPAALGGLIGILGAVLSPAGLVVGALILVGLMIDDLIVYLRGGQSAFGDFLNSIRTDPITGILVSVFGFVAALKILNSGIVVTMGRFALLAAGALAAGAKIALGWIIAMGPIGVLIAAITSVVAGIMLVVKHWDKIKGFAGGFAENVKNFVTGQPPVGSASIATAGKAGATIDNRQTVNLTVPPGTPEAQKQFLQNAAATAFKRDSMAGLNSDLGLVGK